MHGGSGTVAIVLARAGSKRLPGKNLLPLNGEPLIYWTLRAALASDQFDQILVSSDDKRVLDEAVRAGAVALERPADLATDSARSTDVILHVLDTLEAEGIKPKRFMLLQPTSPLRTSQDIHAALNLMDRKGSECVISVCMAEHSPLWYGQLGEDGSMGSFLDSSLRNKNSQEIPQFFRLNGAIYLADTAVFRREKTFFVRNSCAYVMPVTRSVDIDTKHDLLLAEFLFLKGSQVNAPEQI